MDVDANEEFDGLTTLLGAVGTALRLAVGVTRVASGAITAGALIVFATYARRIILIRVWYLPLCDRRYSSTSLSIRMLISSLVGGSTIFALLNHSSFRIGAASGSLR